MSASSHVLTAYSEGVLCVTLNRPKINALNTEMILALQAAFKQADRDPQIRCLLLTGAGENFSAGQDLIEAVDTSYRQHLLRTYNPLIVQIRRLEIPVLAAINGVVTGASLGIVLACDLRIAADNAQFIVGFLGVGLAPDSAVSLLLPAAIGLGRAAEFTFTNAPINADQAHVWGLVNRVVPADELNDCAFEWATQLAQGPVKTMGITKRAFNKAMLPNLAESLDYEAHLQEIARSTAEHHEGLRAFLEKRKPSYK